MYAKVGVGILDPGIAAAVSTRFFVAENEGEDGRKDLQMIASELHVERGALLKNWVKQKIEQDSSRAPLFNRIKPQTHGYNFQAMFNADDVVELSDYDIESVIFDQDYYFAGFKFSGVKA